MRPIFAMLIAGTFLLGPNLTATADDDDDDDDGRHHGRHYFVNEYGYPCEVKREWKKDGEYKEEIKCESRDDDDDRYYIQPQYLTPAPPQPAPTINIVVPIDWLR